MARCLMLGVLPPDVLRSKTPEGIRKEVAARLAAVNIVRVITVEAAAEHGAVPLRVSFAHATRAIVAFAPATATEPIWKPRSIHNAMPTEIAGHPARERPRRNEPRTIRRERKHYRSLRTARRAWRLANAA